MAKQLNTEQFKQVISKEGYTFWEGDYLGNRTYFYRVIEKWNGKPTTCGFKPEGSLQEFADKTIKRHKEYEKNKTI